MCNASCSVVLRREVVVTRGLGRTSMAHLGDSAAGMGTQPAATPGQNILRNRERSLLAFTNCWAFVVCLWLTGNHTRNVFGLCLTASHGSARLATGGRTTRSCMSPGSLSDARFADVKVAAARPWQAGHEKRIASRPRPRTFMPRSFPTLTPRARSALSL